MSFVIKLNAWETGAGGIKPAPLAFRDATGTRWEHRCGWCDQPFMTAAELIGHVVEERQRNG